MSCQNGRSALIKTGTPSNFPEAGGRPVLTRPGPFNGKRGIATCVWVGAIASHGRVVVRLGTGRIGHTLVGIVMALDERLVGVTIVGAALLEDVMVVGAYSRQPRNGRLRGVRAVRTMRC